MEAAQYQQITQQLSQLLSQNHQLSSQMQELQEQNRQMRTLFNSSMSTIPIIIRDEMASFLTEFAGNRPRG